MAAKTISKERKADLLAEMQRQKLFMNRLTGTNDALAVRTEIQFTEPAALMIRERIFVTDRVEMKAEVKFDEIYFFLSCEGKKDMLSEVVRVSEITEDADAAIRQGMVMLCAELMSPDILHNKALRYLDLGLFDKAELLLKQAIMKDESRFLYHYSWALQRWNRHLMSDAAFAAYLGQHTDQTSFCSETLALVEKIRGTAVEYAPPKRDSIRPVTAVSNDGCLRVKGYRKTNADGEERFGFRIEDLQIGETILDVPNEYADFGESTRRDGSAQKHAHCLKSDDVYFAGPNAELIVMDADALWIFDRTGRLVRSVGPVCDGDGNACSCSVLGYTDSGEIVYQSAESVRAIRVQPQIDLPFRKAEVAPIGKRLQDMRDLQKNYEDALHCREQKDYAGMYRALKKSLDAKVLNLHEPSLRLWAELGTHDPQRKKMQPMRFLVVSDTHGQVKKLEAILARESGCSAVFFLGDGARDFETIPIDGELFMAHGNCDLFANRPNDVLVEKAGKRILATHGHRYQVRSDLFTLAAVAHEKSADICLFGHTHVPLEQCDDGLFFFNPGAAANGSYAVLEIAPDGDVLWHPKELE